jgi:hypothetical protein
VKPFVILATQRSGSILLTEMLDSHPDLYCLGEKGGEANRYFLQFMKGLPSHIGFNLKYSQLDRQNMPTKIAQKVDFEHLAQSFRIVHLVRLDIHRLAVSNVINMHRRAPAHTYRTLDHPPFALDPGQVETRLRFIGHKVLHWAQELARLDPPVLMVAYEDLTEGGGEIQKMPAGVAQRLTEYLEVDEQPLTTRMRKVNVDPETYITNWDDIRGLCKGFRKRYRKELEKRVR